MLGVGFIMAVLLAIHTVEENFFVQFSAAGLGIQIVFDRLQSARPEQAIYQQFIAVAGGDVVANLF